MTIKLDMKKWILDNQLLSKSEDATEKKLINLILKEKKFEVPERIMGRLMQDENVLLETIKTYFHPLYKKFTDETEINNKRYENHVQQDQNSRSRLAKGEASKQLKCATKMPPLKHKVADEGAKFDVTDSEVSRWLMQQPEIMQYVFTRIKNSGFIVYDHNTQCWRGSDYSQREII